MLRSFPLLLLVCALFVCVQCTQQNVMRPTALASQPRILFASTTKATIDPTANLTLITGLKLVLPAAEHSKECALVTLSASGPYAHGDNYPGLEFYIVRQDTAQTVARGAVSYPVASPVSASRLPCTVQAVIPLQDHTIPIGAYWVGVRGSGGVIDDEGVTTLSAVIGHATD